MLPSDRLVIIPTTAEGNSSNIILQDLSASFSKVFWLNKPLQKYLFAQSDVYNEGPDLFLHLSQIVILLPH